jgi:hypothetical protein
MIEETPDMDRDNSKRSSYILDNAGEGPSNEKADNMSDQRLSAFLRDEDRGSRGHSPQHSQGSNQSRDLTRRFQLAGSEFVHGQQPTTERRLARLG